MKCQCIWGLITTGFKTQFMTLSSEYCGFSDQVSSRDEAPGTQVRGHKDQGELPIFSDQLTLSDTP